MGSDLACPCSRSELETEENKATPDLISQIMSNKLKESEIILEFLDDQTKLCLIKTVNIEQFFNNRNLLRMNSKKEQMKYYNSVFITNYLARSEFCIIVLQDSPFRYKLKQQTTVTNYSANNSYSNYESSGKYTVDNINLVSSYPDQVVEQLVHNFNTKLKKNYQFSGIINDFPKMNRQFYVLSRLGYSREDISGYSIYVYRNEDRDISDTDIKDIISSPEHNCKKLKSIMVDFVQFSDEESMKEYRLKQKNSSIKQSKKTSLKCK
jgi:hypothetical protein